MNIPQHPTPGHGEVDHEADRLLQVVGRGDQLAVVELSTELLWASLAELLWSWKILDSRIFERAKAHQPNLVKQLHFGSTSPAVRLLTKFSTTLQDLKASRSLGSAPARVLTFVAFSNTKRKRSSAVSGSLLCLASAEKTRFCMR